MLYNQHHRRGGGGPGARRYGGGGPQPWPTGLLVDAPPSPKPWRGRTLSQDNMSWRTVSTSNLSVSDEMSSQESSVADWPGGDSEDGETSVGSGNDGSAVGAAADATAAQQGPCTAANANLGNRRQGDGGDGSSSTGGGGGAAAVRNSGSGGTLAARAGGNRSGEAGFHGGDRTERRHDGDGDSSFVGTGGGAGARATRGEATHRPPLVPFSPIPLVPLAPIPRLRAFPAHRWVHGAYGSGVDGDIGGGGGGGGRKVPVRTVAFAAPPAQALPPRPPGGRGAGVSGEAAPLCPQPIAAATVARPQQEQQQQARMPGTVADVVGGVPPSLGLLLQDECFPAGARGPAEDAGNGIAVVSESDNGGGGARSPAVTAATATGERRETAPPDDKVASGAHHPERGEEGLRGPTPAAPGGSGDIGTTGGAVPKERFAEEGGGESEISAVGAGIGPRSGTAACGAPAARRASGATAVSTKVAVRQWRRLFLP